MDFIICSILRFAHNCDYTIMNCMNWSGNGRSQSCKSYTPLDRIPALISMYTHPCIMLDTYDHVDLTTDTIIIQVILSNNPLQIMNWNQVYT